MSQNIQIQIVVAPSLFEHFEEGLRHRHSSALPENVIVNLVARILDGSQFPIGAKRTGEQEIQIFYRLRSFSQPIF